MGVTRIEDLVAWQRARALTPDVHMATREGPSARDFGLSSQIQRASVSVMSNIAEGFERARPAEFHQSLSTAKASCAEVRSLLYVGLDVGHLGEERFAALMDLATQTANVTGALRASVERRRNSTTVRPARARSGVQPETADGAPAPSTQHTAHRHPASARPRSY